MLESRSIKTDAVLLCVGWIGNTDGIGLGELGVEITRSYIKVDKYLRTNVPKLYAAGDVTGQMMLVSGATHEGHVAAVNAVTNAKTKKVAHALVPTGSFTDPEYGAIGMREQQCRDAGIDYETSVIWCEDLTLRDHRRPHSGLLQTDSGSRDPQIPGRAYRRRTRGRNRATDGHNHGRGTDRGAGR